MQQNIDQIKNLWAKSDRDNPTNIHLLMYHLLESAAVGLVLWNHSFSKSIKQEMAEIFDLSPDVFGNYLAYWIGLHDIGKASPAFQGKLEQKYPALIERIRRSGLAIDPNPTDAYHSMLSGKYLSSIGQVPKQVETAITGHHGKWNTDYRCHSLAFGEKAWDSVRSMYDEVLRNVLAITEKPLSKIDGIEQGNIFTTWFSGVICVADWIASNEEYFPYRDQWEEPQQYYKEAYQKAIKVLQQVGWIGWRTKGDTQTFTEMYHFKGWPGPRVVQQQAIDAYNEFSPQTPFIMVVEAPTGIGKTEIAMYLADRWLQHNDGSGMYIAMPTQATSNQLFERSIDVLKHRYEDQKRIDLVLAHGQARWNEDVNNIRVKEVGEPGEFQGVVASDWFQNNRKRTLLAPFGVGTVDQIFLSILQTKHFFVRLFGLKNKVIIFDEVHAYDTYMNTLFHRLLEWLRAMGASVIILSATLPEETRKQIVSHYCGIEKNSIPIDENYPRVTIASTDNSPVVSPLTWTGLEREISLNWINEEMLGCVLQERLSEGGCAAVICNTVRQSQELYLQIKEQGIVSDEDLILFHARFPFCWRQEIEKKVLEKFGKGATRANGKRPHKAIVIATQVIEQSLDLDFDLMVTELAPVDLILQRAGRLHRHEHRRRPEKLEKPQLMILDIEKDGKGLPLVGKRDPFYGKSTLLRTYFQLHSKDVLRVIANTRSFIEKVYSFDNLFTDIPEEFHMQLQNWHDEEAGIKTMKSNTAEFTTIQLPEYKRFLTRTQKNLRDEDDTHVLEHLKAKTRDGDIGMRIPCLFANEQGELFFDIFLQRPVPSNLTEFDFSTQKELSQNEISIGQKMLIHAILAEAEDIKNYIPYHKHQKFLKFTSGQVYVGGYMMKLSKEIGFTYEKAGGH